jgi:hypothetical protein
VRLTKVRCKAKAVADVERTRKCAVHDLQILMPSPPFRILRCLARVAMWWVLVFAQSGVAPAAATWLAGMAGDHAVNVRPGREGMAIILGHQRECPQPHRHSTVSQMLVAFAQPTDAPHPDHELAFRTAVADCPERLSVPSRASESSAELSAVPWFDARSPRSRPALSCAAPRAPPWLRERQDRRIPGLAGIVMLI